ncbi:hypothetical protein HXP44_32365 [Streptomyces sioyaensis]|uniref:hypothetical protein n=1 Tax=Streptomyces sioyaensis TaxID=67364 RepID=UPI001582E6A7|nr:hypothetical protein [Streptomyces sioyaensis]MBM4796595.1 hypothetical protein [Streptomyces sioyaensis]
MWHRDVALREKTQWKMLYESAARADEVLCLNVEDLYPQDKRGRIIPRAGRPSGSTISVTPLLVLVMQRFKHYIEHRGTESGAWRGRVTPS